LRRSTIYAFGVIGTSFLHLFNRMGLMKSKRYQVRNT